MAPSLRDPPSFVRPSTRDRPMTRGDQGDNSLVIPSRTSSLHSRITQPIPSTLNMKPAQRTPKTLTHAYMVCGVGREPSQWVKAPSPSQGKIGHMKGAVGQFWLPEILGSSPRLEQDNEIARALHAAMRACFPHDVEICTGKAQPHCVHHSFVLQQDSTHTLYGIALRVWSRADEKRAETIRELRKKTESDFYDNPEETYWIPYCLSFLSRYPLYNLLGDYLRGMWIHWNKATNLFHAEEVSRILSFPAPRLNDLVRIDMKDYALCYQFPSVPTGFQNFAMWPLFNCLSIPNIVGVIEAAVSPTRRIIFVSHYPAILTIAAETIRFCVRVYEWSGLYNPVVHARHVKELVQEPGPYILGVTAECRTLFTAPPDALVVDLDRNFVLTSSPPNILTQGQRTKMINRLTQALNGDVNPSGVPQHLRSAYGGGKLVPAGQIIVMRGEVESIQDPSWWNQDAVMSVMDHVCEKLGRNTGMKAIFGGSVKKPLMTKISMRHLNEIVRERNQYSRDALEAWQDFINLKGRMDTELSKVTKRNNFLVEELETWKQQKRPSSKSRLKVINARIVGLLPSSTSRKMMPHALRYVSQALRNSAMTHWKHLYCNKRLQRSWSERGNATKRKLLLFSTPVPLWDVNAMKAQRVVLHLRSLINGQSHHMEHIIRSISNVPELSEYIEQGFDDLPEDDEDHDVDERRPTPRKSSVRLSASSRASSIEGEDVTPDMESHLLNLGKHKRYSQLSITDVADRHLRAKTDAIADIIRNISEQCAAAVEGLHLAQDAEFDSEANKHGDEKRNNLHPTEDGSHESSSRAESDNGDSLLTPNGRNSSVSSIPPTPDLVHNRSSTSMSMVSSTTVPERSSQQYGPGDLPTRIVEADDERVHEADAHHETQGGPVQKSASRDTMRAGTVHVVA
ncbi:conserved hypothetical protein [Uncinocarpus reesii 1704]|uniref:UDENN domain-containing protein n=1 Tax=Uncinocarpus reesii (strain UAMH 1704) TaxID=336963 RepID=C4JKN5_UNCRE|nr:uncharacterized protein UREG_00332 [Uncinocarpus reesii 1704]EEP75486.1 conserved hypothetical protein [Uncinocarpus reesii 1704]